MPPPCLRAWFRPTYRLSNTTAETETYHSTGLTSWNFDPACVIHYRYRYLFYMFHPWSVHLLNSLKFVDFHSVSGMSGHEFESFIFFTHKNKTHHQYYSSKQWEKLLKYVHNVFIYIINVSHPVNLLIIRIPLNNIESQCITSLTS